MEKINYKNTLTSLNTYYENYPYIGKSGID